MGQDQSLSAAAGARRGDAENFRVVQAAAPTVAAGDLSGEPRVHAVTALPLPYPVLPPPEVGDDVASALTGSKMIHELRSVFGSMGNLMPGTAEVASGAGEVGSSSAGEVGDSDAAGSGEDMEGRQLPKNAAPEKDAARSGDALATQERWARAALDVSAVRRVVDDAGGGKALEEALDEQRRIVAAMRAVRAGADRVLVALAATEKEATKTRRALEQLERLRMSAADVQDGLEAALATANILGASHFAMDDELRSFKDYLKCHPPDFPEG